MLVFKYLLAIGALRCLLYWIRDEKRSAALDLVGGLLLRYLSPRAHVCFPYFCFLPCIIILITVFLSLQNYWVSQEPHEVAVKKRVFPR